MQTSETPSLPAADNSSGKPRVNLVSLWRFLGRLVHSLTGSPMQPARLLLRAQCLGFFGAPPQDLPVGLCLLGCRRQLFLFGQTATQRKRLVVEDEGRVNALRCRPQAHPALAHPPPPPAQALASSSLEGRGASPHGHQARSGARGRTTADGAPACTGRSNPEGV